MYYPNTNAILYVVDCNDKQRFGKAADELNKVLEVRHDLFRKKYSKEYHYLYSPTSKICLILPTKKKSAMSLD
jgi:hypothetical protein